MIYRHNKMEKEEPLSGCDLNLVNLVNPVLIIFALAGRQTPGVQYMSAKLCFSIERLRLTALMSEM